MKLNQPKLDIKEHLKSNTEIFKENLKIIINYLVESIWNQKINQNNI